MMAINFTILKHFKRIGKKLVLSNNCENVTTAKFILKEAY